MQTTRSTDKLVEEKVKSAPCPTEDMHANKIKCGKYSTFSLLANLISSTTAFEVFNVGHFSDIERSFGIKQSFD